MDKAVKLQIGVLLERKKTEKTKFKKKTNLNFKKKLTGLVRFWFYKP